MNIRAARKDEYYQGIRDDIITIVPDNIRSILDVGCAFGITGERLKKRPGIKEIVGIEQDRGAYEEARKRLDKVFLGDVQDIDLPYKDGHFDCIIYGDVLEHLVDPWSVLKKHRRFLKDDGIVIASVPNIRHYRIISRLLQNRWDYEERGILDYTHLRFFTLKSLKEMFFESGYEIEKLIYKISGSRVMKILNKILLGAPKEFLAEQFLLIAKKGKDE